MNTPEYSCMYIVTGASDNHFGTLCLFLESCFAIHKHNQHNQCIQQIYVWDLGLSKDNLEYLHSLQNAHPLLQLRRFPYEDYPAYFNIAVSAGEYAWKPVAIHKTALEVQTGILLWCDAGNRFTGALEPLQQVIKSQGVYSPISAGTVGQWTHPGCLAWFGISKDDPILKSSPRNGAIVGFDLAQPPAWALLEEWAQLAQQKDCIAPAGSSRDNHRQDQAVLTLLYYQYTQGKSLASEYISLITHQD